MRISQPNSPVAKAWSGAAARADAMRYAGGDIKTPEAQAKYKTFFLEVDGDPANVGSYKYPYKRLVNGKPQTDAEGLAAAKAMSHGARSGHTDAKASAAADKVSKEEELAARIEALEKQLSEPNLEYTFTKSFDEERYTFGPLYTPGEVDAHNEYTASTALTKAARQVIPLGRTSINKQHDTGNVIGTLVDWVVWPYEQEVELSLPGREVRKAVLPAGTVYAGVVWSEDAWPGVKGGAITGYSMGGRAMRVQSGEILPPMRKAES